MGFNPLQEKGTPIDQQLRPWNQVNVKPYDKETIPAYTRSRIILMNGIESEAVMFLHQFARHTADADLRRVLSMARRVEQQQQKMINWRSPADESILETTIGYEQVAVDLTAALARNEPDKHVRAALDYALLEDFDHLYRYANLLEATENKDAASIVGNFTEIFPGRPTLLEHQHPFDTIRSHVKAEKGNILTQMHVMTIVAAEQQTMNYYMNVGPAIATATGRGLYAEIAQVEEQHVSHYESLLDPTGSWFEKLLMHEYNECYMYYSCMLDEPDADIKAFWQDCLHDEIEHLRLAVDLMKKHEKRDGAELLPESFPELVSFKSNKDYVRKVLRDQEQLTACEPDNYVKRRDLPQDSRYQRLQNQLNANGVPSQQVIQEHIDAHGQDYRLETEGECPIQRFRVRDRTAA